EHVAVVLILLDPPVQQFDVALHGCTNAPVELRYDVIEPAIPQPLPRVRKNLRVRIQTINGRRIPGPPDAERAEANLHPRLQLFDFVVKLLDELVDVGAAPITARKFAAAVHVSAVRLVIGELDVPAGARISLEVRIEIIVDVHTIDVVALHDITDHAHRVF